MSCSIYIGQLSDRKHLVSCAAPVPCPLGMARHDAQERVSFKLITSAIPFMTIWPSDCDRSHGTNL